MREGNSYSFKNPKNKWFMKIGDFTIYHTSEYSHWKAFWLWFMGWEVEKLKGDSDE